ncbi:hypothetical protein [Rhodoferax mekongensis]|uniref:ABC transporter permease n=1 Tax=Rhodoferax mekongensis TaxID=3068341 RepID=A0ABZ0B0V6_9BURK|nr:hypothetical protein [Rhodoferax sp. TBRC 17307]WNO05550.1 hypothetical protein RAN89_03700 [Rhodoferax sp. TBRC 17307]
MNPEFKRNLWLEISPARLALMPAVLTLIALLAVAMSEHNPRDNLFIACTVLFTGLTVGWGSLLVMSSINNEVTERTWDQQRLSALTPWQMAWGKLFGSTAYAWYGALLCAVVAVLAASTLPGFLSRCVWMLAGAIGAVALHAWLMASRLHTLDLRTEKSSSTAGRLFGLFMALQTLPMVFMVLRSPTDEPQASGGWWSLGLPLPVQSLVLAALMLALGLLALWRSMGKQLMVRSTPWAWALGVLAVGWMLAGFMPEDARDANLMVPLAGVALLATYAALFTESNNRLVWQAVLFHHAHSPRRRMLQALPLWPVSWAMAALFVLLYGVLGINPDQHLASLGSVMWLALLHCLRDCGIYHFFALRNTTRKPAGMTLLTLFVLGVVLPGLVAGSAPELATWFEPLFGLQQLVKGGASLGLAPWLAMAVQLAVVAALVAWRWAAGAKPAQTS